METEHPPMPNFDADKVLPIGANDSQSGKETKPQTDFMDVLNNTFPNTGLTPLLKHDILELQEQYGANTVELAELARQIYNGHARTDDIVEIANEIMAAMKKQAEVKDGVEGHPALQEDDHQSFQNQQVVTPTPHDNETMGGKMTTQLAQPTESIDRATFQSHHTTVSREDEDKLRSLRSAASAMVSSLFPLLQYQRLSGEGTWNRDQGDIIDIITRVIVEYSFDLDAFRTEITNAINAVEAKNGDIYEKLDSIIERATYNLHTKMEEKSSTSQKENQTTSPVEKDRIDKTVKNKKSFFSIPKVFKRKKQE